jgi:predicted ArsR family transcriptional regulator
VASALISSDTEFLQLLRTTGPIEVSEMAQQVRVTPTAVRQRLGRLLLQQRRIPFSVSQANGLPILTAHACPYPELADNDRTICALERVLFSDLLGRDVEIASCRLDGGELCRFQPS